MIDAPVSLKFRDDDGDFCEFRAESALDLVEWIYLQYPEKARKILREKLMFSKPLTAFEQGLVKVAAKRFAIVPVSDEVPSASAETVNHNLLIEMRRIHHQRSTENFSQQLGGSFTNLQNAVQWVSQQARALKVEGSRVGKDRPIVAALFDNTWKLLGAFRNTNNAIRTRHAEMNLLFGLKTIPEEAVLIVSTQCCRMCAAALREKLGSASLKIYFLEPEPALKHVKTALHGIEQKFSSEN